MSAAEMQDSGHSTALSGDASMGVDAAKTAHTQGPWTLERTFRGWAIYGPPGSARGTPGLRVICEVVSHGHADAAADANAALLLTAIEPRYTQADVAAAHAEGYKLGLAQQDRAAIAKAAGSAA